MLGDPGTREPREEPRHLLDMDPDELRRWLCSEGYPRFRADQVLQWIYEKRIASFDEMTNLSKPLRAWLGQRVRVYESRVVRESCSTDGTRKLLLAWCDGETTETVWIPEELRNTACLSTQVGCPVGCRFCASGIDGLRRNLTAGEIVEQALRVARLIDEQPPDTGAPGRLSNIVIMGMGEPLANYGPLVKAIRTLNASWGLGIGARRITVSTIGLPKQIRQLAQEDLQLSLALSLHAPEDELRWELIPWTRMVTVDELVDACRYFFETTGREITLEYVLLDGVNMLPEHAEGVAKITRRLRANVNLLRYNPVPGLPYRRPNAEATHVFQRCLRERGVNAHVRTSRGGDVDAACGQLRRATGETP